VAKKYRDVRAALRDAGFELIQTSGSHEVWRHQDGRQTTLPAGGKANREVASGTLASIRRDTGLENLR
jgi:predicted RNA binding protein YcfA (HicA-like mRNA interferase family)